MTRGYRDDDDRMDEDEGVDFPNVTCIRETTDAILVSGPIEDGDGEVWIPKKMVHADSEVYASGHEGKLIVKTWLANKRGWI